MGIIGLVPGVLRSTPASTDRGAAMSGTVAGGGPEARGSSR